MDAICGKGWRVDKQEAGKHRNEGALLLQSVATRLYHTQSWTREEGALLHHQAEPLQGAVPVPRTTSYGTRYSGTGTRVLVLVP